MKNFNKIYILGVPVDKVTEAEALSRFEELICGEKCSRIITLNPEMIMNARHDEQFKSLIKSADMAFPDGIGLVYASKIIKKPLSERITGIDFTYKALKIIAGMGKSAYFLGAKPGIAEAAAKNIKAEIPGLNICGVCDGYFKPDEEESIVDEINASGADLLCLALGSPKQEYFALKYQSRLKCKVAIGIGGSFDVWSGSLKRAPEFYIKHNIEWLYRLLQEPSRFGRILLLPKFLVKVIFSPKNS